MNLRRLLTPAYFKRFVRARVPTGTDWTGAHIKMCHLQRTRAPLATSGRFRRSNQPKTPQHAGVSSGLRSWQRTTPAKKPHSPGPMAKAAPISCETAQKSRGATAGKAAATVNANAGAARGIAVNAPPSPCSPASGAENRLTAPPPGAAARDLHPARCLARPAGKHSESSSQKRAIHLRRLDSATLLSAYRSLTAASTARQHSIRLTRFSSSTH